MALWDFLKRKKEVEKTKEKKPFFGKATEGKEKAEKKAERVSVAKSQKNAEINVETRRSGKKSTGGFSYDIVKEPHISEKGTYLAEKNQYIFRIYNRSNKPEIKKAVEGIYGVDVLSVNTIKIPAKKRRLGKTEGFKKGYSKAIVKIKEGQKIEIL